MGLNFPISVAARTGDAAQTEQMNSARKLQRTVRVGSVIIFVNESSGLDQTISSRERTLVLLNRNVEPRFCWVPSSNGATAVLPCANRIFLVFSGMKTG